MRTELGMRLDVPHIIKYMGSKSSLLTYISEAIEEIYEGERICDLFAGSAILSGALGDQFLMHSNDIQEYSNVLAKTYLGNYNWDDYDLIMESVVTNATDYVDRVKRLYPDLSFEYNEDISLEDFNAIEQQQQELIYLDFPDVEHHLFIKSYSGTYWSYEQCLWIDAIRNSAEEYRYTEYFYPILSCLMHSMAYNAQSTGHYAQYRDANNVASMNDIIIYRNKEILPFFQKKRNELKTTVGSPLTNHTVTNLDYRDCLDNMEDGCLVYADPPYAFVHYSRFYHAIETLVKYDYPEVAYKGRYRKDRHQSPFCKRTEVKDAFRAMFQGVKIKRSKLILSYSNTGMISLEDILSLAQSVFGNEYVVSSKAIDYIHSTMGRSDDKSREVKEYLIIATHNYE